MYIPDPEQVLLLLTSSAAIYERLRNRKKELKTEAEEELLSDAKRHKERADVYATELDKAEVRFQHEAALHQKTRDFYHDKLQKDTADRNKIELELADARAKPDYSDILVLVKQQGDYMVIQSDFMKTQSEQVTNTLNRIDTTLLLIEKHLPK